MQAQNSTDLIAAFVSDILFLTLGVDCGYLGWGADLHMAQQMPLPLTISFSS